MNALMSKADLAFMSLSLQFEGAYSDSTMLGTRFFKRLEMKTIKSTRSMWKISIQFYVRQFLELQ